LTLANMIDKKGFKGERSSHVNNTYQYSSNLFEELISTDTPNCLEGARVCGWYWSDDSVPRSDSGSARRRPMYHTKNRGLDLVTAQLDPLPFPSSPLFAPFTTAHLTYSISTTSPPLKKPAGIPANSPPAVFAH
jgi:hypothetical protein